MYQKLLKRTTIYCFVFFIIAMAGMFYFDANKIIVIADSATTTGEIKELKTQYQLLMKNNDTGKNQIVIPLEDTVLAEDVQIQNRYIDNELWIGIEGASTEFYGKEYIMANLEKITYGGYDFADKVLWIKFSMNDVYEFKSTMNNGKMTIEAQKPQDVHKKIFVLDMLASLAISLIAILYPVITRNMLNVFIPEKQYSLIVIAGVGLFVIYFIRMLLM